MPEKEVKCNLRYSSRSRAQSSVEFLILAGFMTFIFLVFLAAIGGQIIDAQRTRDDNIAYDIMDTVEEELNLAQSALNGYERIFTMPDSVNNVNYSIRLYDNLLIVRYNERFYERPF